MTIRRLAHQMSYRVLPIMHISPAVTVYFKGR
jgi:hypothetical protein